jgi:hypothetical protein
MEYSIKIMLLWILVSPLLLVPSVFSQTGTSDIEALKKSAPKVFIDCGWCDEDYIRTEITFINYVRDRKEAEVHVLITTLETGSGGTEYTLAFIGQGPYNGLDDTLKYIANATDTQDEIRKGLVRTLKAGLMRYVAKTPIRDRISISFTDKVKPTSVVDKWDSWVFSLNGNSYFNGEKLYKYINIYGNISANRTTPELKIKASVSASHSSSRYIMPDDTIQSSSDSRSFGGLVVKSLSPHWSAGGFFSASSSTYQNIRLAITPVPAIEYDLFPYSESTRRQLRFLYRLGFTNVRYREQTIYDKTRENLWNQQISITLELKEKWGSVSTSLDAAHYLHDLGKSRVEASGDLSLRLFKGLSIYAGVSRIHDQLSLPKGEANLEEILLRRTMVATNYSYYGSVGLSYTFGSIYSNVVNPRFGSSGGGLIIIH